MKKLHVIVLFALCCGAVILFRNERHDRFAANMKKEFRGYRLEYFNRENVLFIHAPDGSRNGMPLDRKCIDYIILRKILAEDNTLKKDLYRWEIQFVLAEEPFSPFGWIRRSFLVPYFAFEPKELLVLLRKEFPEINMAKALRQAKDLERGNCSDCTIWIRPDYNSREEPKAGETCPY